MTQQTEATPTTQKQNTGSRIIVRPAGAAALVIALVAVGTVPRLARQREALAAVNESPITHPVVTIIRPKAGEPTSSLLLPGNIEPLYSASLYARVDGYLDRRNVDIGLEHHALSSDRPVLNRVPAVGVQSRSRVELDDLCLGPLQAPRA